MNVHWGQNDILYELLSMKTFLHEKYGIQYFKSISRGVHDDRD